MDENRKVDYESAFKAFKMYLIGQLIPCQTALDKVQTKISEGKIRDITSDEMTHLQVMAVYQPTYDVLLGFEEQFTTEEN
jgi:hypothetical protein